MRQPPVCQAWAQFPAVSRVPDLAGSCTRHGDTAGFSFKVLVYLLDGLGQGDFRGFRLQDFGPSFLSYSFEDLAIWASSKGPLHGGRMLIVLGGWIQLSDVGQRDGVELLAAGHSGLEQCCALLSKS